MFHRNLLSVIAVLALCATNAHSDLTIPGLEPMCMLGEGETHMVNALWIENPDEMRMGEGRDTVAVADIQGPGIITMIHFAMPATLTLNRDTVIRMYWDGETEPSVNCPLTDFFGDPNGALERVNSALVNKKRGWNAYFLMPFAKSARIEIASDNARYPGTWERNPCYSYVMYRALDRLPKNMAYFHARWRQETLLMGNEDYLVFETAGEGHFIGWNVTIRGAGGPEAGYPVDMNEKFYIDGEAAPSIEWQGIEDSFGFSWGFPESANEFPLTGWQPYYKVGAAAYRFCLNDRITFRKSLRMTVGFGEHEHPMFHEMFSKPENPLQLSSVAYWYQREPHQTMPPLPSASERRPVFQEETRAVDPTPYRQAGETIVLACGKKEGDIEFLEDGWDFRLRRGYLYEGWPTEVNHCWADKTSLEFDILCPKGASGTLRLYIIDGDNFQGGRKQSITVAGRLIGEYENFQQGQWIEVPITAADTAEGCIPVVAANLREGSNAVVSCIRLQRSTP